MTSGKIRSDPMSYHYPIIFCVCFSKVVAHSSFFCAFGSPFSPLSLRVIEFLFLTTVDVGQYFMTKDTEELSQFTDSVACREYTLPRDETSSDPKAWIRGNTKIGPVLEVTTSYQQSKYGVEFRIESVNKDCSHSWVRISHGLNKLVTELSNDKENDNDEQGNLRDAVRQFCVEIECTCFGKPIKGQSKTTKTYSCQPIHKNFTHGAKKVD